MECIGSTRVAAGIDVGSVSSQAVILADGKISAYSSVRTGASSPGSARRALEAAVGARKEGCDRADSKEHINRIDRIDYIVGTGYGRVNIELAQRTMTEIACHARGARRIYGPSLRTVVDMGGQDCKVIRLDDRGRPTDFLMNDRCAAGTGRGLEVFAALLGVDIEEMGELSLSPTEKPPVISSTCVVFAKTEALSLLRKGHTSNDVLASYCDATAKRVHALINRIGMEREVGITGGIAKNVGVVKRLEALLGFRTLTPSTDTQLAGALGAALFADAILRKKTK
jgi:bzd-type benzoyl-CoA reductase Q subunit